MVNQTKNINIPANIAGWVVANMIAILLVGIPLYASYIPGIANNPSIRGIIDNVCMLSSLAGGLLVAGFQWIFLLLRLQPKFMGGSWMWAITGAAGTAGSFCLVAFSILALGDYPTEKDELFITLLIIYEQLIVLSMVQGLLLWLNKYKKILPWATSNLVGYVLAAILSWNVIYRWTDDIRAFFVFSIFFTILVTAVSGWELIRVFESREDDNGKITSGG